MNKNKIIGVFLFFLMVGNQNVFAVVKDTVSYRLVSRELQKSRRKVNTPLASQPLLKNKYAARKPELLSSASKNISQIEFGKPTKILLADTFKVDYPLDVEAKSPVFKDAALFNITYLDVNQGLSSSYIVDFIFDSKGFAWFATLDGGISRYDGASFQHFTVKNGLPRNRVYSITEDDKGNIWMGTDGGGVSVYDGNNIIQITEKAGLGNNFIYDIYQTGTGAIICVGAKGSISVIEGNSVKVAKLESEYNEFTFNKVYKDSYNTIWLSSSNGIYSLNDDIVTRYKFEDRSIGSTWEIFEDRDRILWIASDIGILRYDRSRFTLLSRDQGFSSLSFISIFQSQNGLMWFGTYGDGVFSYDGKNIAHYTEFEGLSIDFVWKITEDPFGNLWFATDGGGISILRKSSFRYYTEEVRLSSNYILSIETGENNELWLGTYGGGVNIMDEDKIQYLDEAAGLSSNYVYAVEKDKENNFWIATDNQGLEKYDGESFQKYSVSSGLKENTLRYIYSDQGGRIWLGYESLGFGYIEDGRIFHLKGTERSLDYPVKHIVSAAKDSAVYISTVGSGVISLKDEKVEIWNKANGYPSNEINTILEDEFGNLWVGTASNGIYVVRGNELFQLTSGAGLISDVVSSILEDKKGRIWVATNSGLSYFKNPFRKMIKSEADFLSNLQIENIDQKNGLKAIDFFRNSAVMDQEGNMWWGTGKHLANLEMDEFNSISNFKNAPKVFLNSIKINQEQVDFRQVESVQASYQFDNVVDYFNYPQKIVLNPSARQVSFNFSVIDWLNEGNADITYKLEGLDDQWSKPRANHTIEFTNLDPGNYQLKVKALGTHFEESKVFLYPFKVLSPWYATWWAYSLYLISGSLIIIYLVKFRTYQLEKRKSELEKEVKTATKELTEKNTELITLNAELTNQRNELKDALTNLQLAQNQLVESEKMASLGILSAGMAHEINNPLNFIKGGVISIKKQLEFEKKEKNEDLNPFLEAIEEGVNRASTIVKSLNHFSRQDSSKDDLCNIHQVIDNCLVMISNEIKYKMLSIEKNYTTEVFELRGNEGQLHQAVLNILTNATQALRETGKIIITTEVIGKNLMIKIKDTGIGISIENINRINDPFFTTKEPGKGTGLGLSITYSIIENHGGTIFFESQEGNWTEVTIKLPARKK